MTLSAALFGTAVRALRTVAVRRTLQLILLVGGLSLLGLLGGQQAHAAEGTPAAPAHTMRTVHAVHAVQAVRSITGQQGAAPSAARNAAPEAVRDAVADAVRDGTRDAVRDTVGTAGAVTERVVTPVRDVVHVVRTAPRALEEPRAEAPALPAAPSVPLPKLPGVSELPVDPVPVPVGPEPGTHRHGGSAPVPAPGKSGHSGTGTGSGTKARTAAPARPHALAYGPGFTRVSAQSAVHIRAQRTAVPVDAPAQPAPGGDTEGALGKQTADGSASRHGDAQAVTFDGRAPLRLLSGAAACADAPGTLERHRDIPVFPG
ncbi:hypothetical protein AB0E10_27530 [Streptomyces sp. NPDC048045]|uniref:hypothetical protein n=1 Tax=Streptomyces sp. NPDC048045 TaxID=3154710 RepID=UPI00342098DD